jgi:hypothetical protein
MSEQTRAVLIRCCASDWLDAISLYDVLIPLGVDVYLVYAGETLPATVPASLMPRLIQINAAFLGRTDLYAPRLELARLTWQCGDVALFAAAEVVQADYFWMIEPDVYASPALFRRLFTTTLEADFYAPLLRHERERWFWYEGTHKYLPDVWACIFCFLAIRRAVLPGLQQKRAQILAAWNASGDIPRLMPNDEGLVCSCLSASGYRCADLNSLFAVYNKRSIRFGMPGSRRSLELRGGAGGLVHHPVYTGTSFDHKVQLRLADLGLSYDTARDILIEHNVLPIAPFIDQILTLGYLVLIHPRATLRRVSLKARGLAKRFTGRK